MLPVLVVLRAAVWCLQGEAGAVIEDAARDAIKKLVRCMKCARDLVSNENADHFIRVVYDKRHRREFPDDADTPVKSMVISRGASDAVFDVARAIKHILELPELSHHTLAPGGKLIGGAAPRPAPFCWLRQTLQVPACAVCAVCDVAACMQVQHHRSRW